MPKRPPHATERTIGEALAEAEARYVTMIDQLRAGHRLPEQMIALVLTLAERSAANLVRDVLTTNSTIHRPGDPCPRRQCAGKLVQYKSRRAERWLTQYLKCDRCKMTGKRVLPAASVPRRRRG